MSRRLSLTLLVAALALAIAVPVLAQKPDFGPHIYADGEAWGTKVLGELPTPNDTMEEKSFDALYVITNSNEEDPDEDQLPVGEAAPGKDYNGGRWAVKTVMWTQKGFDDHGTVPILKSDDAIELHESLGHLVVTDGSFQGGPPDYFECPLLPVK